jgi:SAM-dependent methyltransferase
MAKAGFMTLWRAPHKFRYALKYRGSDSPLKILDIGCGNHGPTIAKHYFPNAEYHGVDIIQDYNQNADDHAKMDQFFLVQPDGSGYEQIPDNAYDLIVASHVIEHMSDPYSVLRTLSSKAKPGGIFYISFPSERSLHLPSSVDRERTGTVPTAATGTLNFCDDDTHTFLPSVREVANVLLPVGFRIVYGGPPQDMVRFLSGMFIRAPVEWLRYKVLGYRRGKGLWAYYGFESCVCAVKR